MIIGKSNLISFSLYTKQYPITRRTLDQSQKNTLHWITIHYIPFPIHVHPGTKAQLSLWHWLSWIHFYYIGTHNNVDHIFIPSQSKRRHYTNETSFITLCPDTISYAFLHTYITRSYTWRSCSFSQQAYNKSRHWRDSLYSIHPPFDRNSHNNNKSALKLNCNQWQWE